MREHFCPAVTITAVCLLCPCYVFSVNTITALNALQAGPWSNNTLSSSKIASNIISSSWGSRKKKIQRNTNTNQQLQVYMKNIYLWITFTLYKQINYRQLSNLPRIIWSKSCYFCAGKKYTVKCHHECNRNAKNVLITCPCDHIAHIYCSLKGTCVEETWSFHASSTVYISVRAPAGM